MNCIGGLSSELTGQSLRSSKFLLQFTKIHFDDCGPAMGASVGHRAVAEIFEKVFQFTPGKRIIGFDGVAADGFSDRVLA